MSVGRPATHERLRALTLANDIASGCGDDRDGWYGAAEAKALALALIEAESRLTMLSHRNDWKHPDDYAALAAELAASRVLLERTHEELSALVVSEREATVRAVKRGAEARVLLEKTRRTLKQARAAIVAGKYVTGEERLALMEIDRALASVVAPAPPPACEHEWIDAGNVCLGAVICVKCRTLTAADPRVADAVAKNLAAAPAPPPEACTRCKGRKTITYYPPRRDGAYPIPCPDCTPEAAASAPPAEEKP